MKASEVLRRARGLIERPELWSKHRGLEQRGEGILARCGYHAVADPCFYDGNFHSEPYLAATRALEQTISGGNYARWQEREDIDHPEVLAAFDRAIQLAEAEEATQ